MKFQDPRTGPDSTIPLPVRRLLLWYRKNRRNLPWRGKATPYAVWVSEVMLQQTQVNAVIPYFQSFMQRFPTVSDLACAPLEEVLKTWEGMGYYARARQLHKAAALVVGKMGGHLPQTYGALITLPGLGPYSAAAIASICFGERDPVMDGNVLRVISRFLAFDADLSRSNARSRIHEYLLKHIPRQSPGDFNQALMELGALLCRPGDPDCSICPLAMNCKALQQDRVGDYPVRKERGDKPHRVILVGIIRKRGRILIERRPEEGMLGGLWQFPGGLRKGRTTFARNAEAIIREKVGLKVKAGKRSARVRHAYSHFHIALHAYDCEVLGGRLRSRSERELLWVRLEETDSFPFPSVNRKVLRILNQSL